MGAFFSQALGALNEIEPETLQTLILLCLGVVFVGAVVVEVSLERAEAPPPPAEGAPGKSAEPAAAAEAEPIAEPPAEASSPAAVAKALDGAKGPPPPAEGAPGKSAEPAAAAEAEPPSTPLQPDPKDAKDPGVPEAKGDAVITPDPEIKVPPKMLEEMFEALNAKLLTTRAERDDAQKAAAEKAKGQDEKVRELESKIDKLETLARKTQEQLKKAQGEAAASKNELARAKGEVTEVRLQLERESNENRINAQRVSELSDQVDSVNRKLSQAKDRGYMLQRKVDQSRVALQDSSNAERYLEYSIETSNWFMQRNNKRAPSAAASDSRSQAPRGRSRRA